MLGQKGQAMFAICDGRRIEQNIGLIMKPNFFAVCFERRRIVGRVISDFFMSADSDDMFPTSIVQAVCQSGAAGTLNFPSFTIAVNGSYDARNGRLCIRFRRVVHIPPGKVELQVVDGNKTELDIDGSIVVAVRLAIAF